MLRRLARLALTLVMVAFVAATPLSAHLSGGTHEMWVSDYVNGKPTRVRIVLFDSTGLVSAIAPGESATSTPTTIVVRWHSCGSSELSFSRSPVGFVLSDRSIRFCIFGGAQSMAINFGVPIDRGSITFDESGEWYESDW